MGLLDKLLGRDKKAADDLTGDASIPSEGARQEQAAEAEDTATEHEDLAQQSSETAAEERAASDDT